MMAAMSSDRIRVPYEEYLREERLELWQHQWIDGEVSAMVAGSLEHARLKAKLIGIIGNGITRPRCVVFGPSLRLRSHATNIATYADLTVVCDRVETDPEDRDAVTNPTLLVEVLSPLTEAFDRGDKAWHYRRIPSLCEYLLVSENEPHIEVFRRGEAGNWYFLEAFAGESLTLESVGCTISIDEVYANPVTDQ
jgi:Uma2 family endonuclease